MIWKRYRNEFIVLIAMVLMLAASLYKSNVARKLDTVNHDVKTSMVQIGEIIALRKQWGNKSLRKKIERIKQGITKEKIKLFSIKGNKLNASFVGLSDREMNAIILKLENIAVQINKIRIKREKKNYRMEIVCKW